VNAVISKRKVIVSIESTHGLSLGLAVLMKVIVPKLICSSFGHLMDMLMNSEVTYLMAMSKMVQLLSRAQMAAKLVHVNLTNQPDNALRLLII